MFGTKERLHEGKKTCKYIIFPLFEMVEKGGEEKTDVVGPTLQFSFQNEKKTVEREQFHHYDNFILHYYVSHKTVKLLYNIVEIKSNDGHEY